MRRIAVVFAVLAVMAVMTTNVGVRADGHRGNEIKLDLGEQEKGKRSKVSSALTALYEEYQAYVKREGTDEGFQPSNPLMPVVGNRVLLDAVAQGNAEGLKNDLKGLGLKKASRFGRKVSGRLPIKAIKKMGSLSEMMNMIPGLGRLTGRINPADMDDGKIARVEAIILSMTPQERRNPKIINGSRRKRIADGSGATPSDVNQLMSQFTQVQKMMKRFSRGGNRQRMMDMIGR